MTQMIAIDARALDALKADIAELKEILRHSQIQPAPEWVSISQAARILECSETTIRRRIDRGEMEAQGAGKARKVRVR
jgi:excisionase family DNA binding protein